MGYPEFTPIAELAGLTLGDFKAQGDLHEELRGFRHQIIPKTVGASRSWLGRNPQKKNGHMHHMHLLRQAKGWCTVLKYPKKDGGSRHPLVKEPGVRHPKFRRSRKA